MSKKMCILVFLAFLLLCIPFFEFGFIMADLSMVNDSVDIETIKYYLPVSIVVSVIMAAGNTLILHIMKKKAEKEKNIK